MKIKKLRISKRLKRAIYEFKFNDPYFRRLAYIQFMQSRNLNLNLQ